MYLNIAIVNNSGNVGKSTICETMLKPRIPNAEVVKVETINSDGTDDAKFQQMNLIQFLNKWMQLIVQSLMLVLLI